MQHICNCIIKYQCMLDHVYKAISILSRVVLFINLNGFLNTTYKYAYFLETTRKRMDSSLVRLQGTLPWHQMQTAPNAGPGTLTPAV